VERENEATKIALSDAGPEFHIEVNRSEGGPLGIEVEPCTECLLQIMSIGKGLVQEWNDANPEEAVEEQDYICAANSIYGDTDLLLDECRATKPLKLTLRRPFNKVCPPPMSETTFQISVDKQDGKKLGIDVNHEHGGELFIESIDDGLIADWNRDNPDSMVLPEDRIVEVNSKKGDVQLLLNECMKNIVLDMTILRCEVRDVEY
jgi:hypothetical protein